MPFIFDIVIAAIIILSMYFGYKKGFIRAIMNLISFAAAFIVSMLLTDNVSALIRSSSSFQKFTDSVASSIESMLTSGGEATGISQLFSDKPQAFINIIERFGMNISDLEAKYQQGLADGVSETSHSIASYLTDPVSNAISSAIAFVLIFVVTLLAVKLLMLILDKFCKLPILNAANHVIGLIIGTLCGLLYAWVISIVISQAAPALSQLYPSLFAANLTENTVLLKWLCSYNPFGWLTSLF